MKVTIREMFDWRGNKFWHIEKSRGGITRAEAYEAMCREGLYGHYLADFRVPEDADPAFYDGPQWWDVYEPEVLMAGCMEDKFNEGYEACMKDMEAENESRF